jgi:hypothetical protein
LYRRDLRKRSLRCLVGRGLVSGRRGLFEKHGSKTQIDCREEKNNKKIKRGTGRSKSRKEDRESRLFFFLKTLK